MKLKKSVLIGSTLAILSIPMIANADLVTTNNTNQYSSVKISSNGGLCSGVRKSGITAPLTETHTSSTDVKALCGTASGICSADIYMESSYDNAKTCNGIYIGWAKLDVTNDIVTEMKTEDSSGYTASGKGSNHITISKL